MSNLYDVFELLLDNATLAEPERAKAQEIISDLKRANVFGSTVASTDGPIHNYELQHEYGQGSYRKCTYCGKRAPL